MDAGNYTLVLIQDTPMLQNVPALGLLERLGLAAGTDYAQVSVSIQDGVLTDVGPVSVPALARTPFPI